MAGSLRRAGVSGEPLGIPLGYRSRELTFAFASQYEDVHLSTASLTFEGLMLAALPEDVPSPMRIPTNLPTAPAQTREVRVDEVLPALNEALAYVEAHVVDVQLRTALVGHIALRIVRDVCAISSRQLLTQVNASQDFIYSIALLSSPPHVTPQQVTEHLTSATESLQILLSPALSTPVATPKLLATFALGAESPLAAPQPPREIKSPTSEEAKNSLKRMFADLQAAMELWTKWGEGAGWKEVRVSCVEVSVRCARG